MQPAQSLGVEPVDDRILNAKPRKYSTDDPIVLTPALLIASSDECRSYCLFDTQSIF